MKTLLVFPLIFLPVAAPIALDSPRLDAAGWFSAVAVAGLFAVALGDTGTRRRSPAAGRPARPGATSSAAWAEKKSCVLCAAASS
jgi:hypothetical protein